MQPNHLINCIDCCVQAHGSYEANFSNRRLDGRCAQHEQHTDSNSIPKEHAKCILEHLNALNSLFSVFCVLFIPSIYSIRFIRMVYYRARYSLDIFINHDFPHDRFVLVFVSFSTVFVSYSMRYAVAAFIKRWLMNRANAIASYCYVVLWIVWYQQSMGQQQVFSHKPSEYTWIQNIACLPAHFF